MIRLASHHTRQIKRINNSLDHRPFIDPAGTKAFGLAIQVQITSLLSREQSTGMPEIKPVGEQDHWCSLKAVEIPFVSYDRAAMALNAAINLSKNCERLDGPADTPEDDQERCTV